MPNPLTSCKPEYLLYFSISLSTLVLLTSINPPKTEGIMVRNGKQTGPVTAGQINAARDSFELYYDRANQNLDTDDVVIKMDTFMSELFQRYPSRKDSGYMFHYALSQDEESIFYIMSQGVYDFEEDTAYHYPFGKDDFNDTFEYYLLLHGNSPEGEYRAINESEFCNFTQRYEKNFNRLYDSIITPVSSITNHPFSVYHEGEELNEFVEEYQPDTSDVLLLRHCAAPLGSNIRSYHIPVFIFMWQGTGNTDYDGKGLDIGKTCPPFCSANMESFCD